MKNLGCWLGLFSASILQLHAQVRVEVVLDQEQFLPGETLPVAVRITNRSGQTLRLGADPDWLIFSVESRDGSVVPKLADVPVAGEFSLDSSKVAIKHVELDSYFSVLQPGRYEVVATVNIKDWDEKITSVPKGFDIVHGTKLWEQEVGLPKTSTPKNRIPEVRKYILQRASYLRSQLRLYLRVTDSSTERVFRVVAIGPMLSFSQPEPQVDTLNNLHVLYQDGPHTFSYTVFTPDGDLTTRQTYEYVNSRPRLRADDDGNISVFGGLRRTMANDVPPPPPPTNDVEKPKP